MTRILLTLAAALVAASSLVVQAVAQTAGYRIQPGDQITVTVLEDETLNRQLLVLPDGRISVPLAGSVTAAGQTVEQVERVIADRLAGNFAVRPNVFVSVVQVEDALDTFNVYVLGRVGAPGLKEVEVGTTLLQAVALAGGFDRFAATRRIQLRRTDPATGQERLFLFNYAAVERGSPIQSMIALREGDVIIVPERRLFE
jgi:polysaccharide biosynthesis/export protein